jgi:hypothetical protein
VGRYELPVLRTGTMRRIATCCCQLEGSTRWVVSGPLLFEEVVENVAVVARAVVTA